MDQGTRGPEDQRSKGLEHRDSKTYKICHGANISPAQEICFVWSLSSLYWCVRFFWCLCHVSLNPIPITSRFANCLLIQACTLSYTNYFLLNVLKTCKYFTRDSTDFKRVSNCGTLGALSCWRVAFIGMSPLISPQLTVTTSLPSAGSQSPADKARQIGGRTTRETFRKCLKTLIRAMCP